MALVLPVAAEEGPVLAPDTPVTPADQMTNTAHNSPVVVTDPTEGRFVVMATRLDAPDFGCALQVSGNGGASFVPAGPLPDLPPGAEKCYAPEVAFGPDGTLYYLFVGLAGNGNSPMGTFLTTSTDRARTFTPPIPVLGPGNYMVRMAIDPDLGDNGRIHLVWLAVGPDTPLGGLPVAPNPIMAAHSDDGGASFTEPVRVSDPNRLRAVGPVVAIGQDHAVHVGYYDLEDDIRDYQGLEGPTWEGTWSLVLATSTDAGDRYGPSRVIADGVKPTGRVMLIYTMPPPALVTGVDGDVFAAWPDARHGDPDVLMAGSSDGGVSWTPPRRLNDDPVGNDADQSLPRLAVATNGRLDAVFLDRRRDPGNVYTDVYYTYSNDGGVQFAPNLRINAQEFDSRIGQRYLVPSARGLVELGSRLGLLSRPTAAVAAWPDTRNSPDGTPAQEIFSTTVYHPTAEVGRSWLLPVVAVLAAGALLVGVTLILRRRRPSAVQHGA